MRLARYKYNIEEKKGTANAVPFAVCIYFFFSSSRISVRSSSVVGLGSASASSSFCFSVRLRAVLNALIMKNTTIAMSRKSMTVPMKLPKPMVIASTHHLAVYDLGGADKEIQRAHVARAAYPAYKRHEQVIYKRGRDLAEGRCDNDADGHIEDVAAADKGFEFFK